MVRVAMVGIGKMGISHLAMARAHPGVELVGVCDSVGYVLDVLSKYTGLRTFTDYLTMLETVAPDAVIIATPSSSHVELIRVALARGLHVFCEKPLTLSSAQSDELAAMAAARGLVTQVGYHNRFVGAFQEAKRLLDLGAIGAPTHALAESYGPVVLRPKGITWRSKRITGGGSLYDYAAHPLDLLSWYFGEAESAGGTVIAQVFSTETDDQVYSTLRYPASVSAQLSVDWSDESQRKMTTKISIWGTAGKIEVDRQECLVYLRDVQAPPPGYQHGWNSRYTTALTPPVWFNLRGEEYSAQMDHFVRAVVEGAGRSGAMPNDFASAASTDRAIEMVLAAAGPQPVAATAGMPAPRKSSFGLRAGKVATH